MASPLTPRSFSPIKEINAPEYFHLTFDPKERKTRLILNIGTLAIKNFARGAATGLGTGALIYSGCQAGVGLLGAGQAAYEASQGGKPLAEAASEGASAFTSYFYDNFRGDQVVSMCQSSSVSDFASNALTLGRQFGQDLGSMNSLTKFIFGAAMLGHGFAAAYRATREEHDYVKDLEEKIDLPMGDVIEVQEKMEGFQHIYDAFLADPNFIAENEGKELMGPISHGAFIQPVRTTTCEVPHYFEASEIAKHLAIREDCPICRKPLRAENLVEAKDIFFKMIRITHEIASILVNNQIMRLPQSLRGMDLQQETIDILRLDKALKKCKDVATEATIEAIRECYIRGKISLTKQNAAIRKVSNWGYSREL